VGIGRPLPRKTGRYRLAGSETRMVGRYQSAVEDGGSQEPGARSQEQAWDV
jgi:hypothetical protein